MRRSHVALSALTLLAASACGSDSTSPKSSLSPQEARTVASALFNEMARAIGSPTPTTANGAAQSVAAGPTVNLAISAACTNGGTLKGTFNFADNTNTVGTGTINGTVTVTADDCNISTGERTISTDGGYTFTFSAGFTNHRLSSNFKWDASGTLTWTGGSCTLDYTVELAPNGTRTLSGTICGVDVKGSVT